MNDENRNIVFFDAKCLLCNRSVQFLLHHDKRNRLYFATLQSDVAKRLMLHAPENILHQDSIIFYQNQRFYIASNAVLKIAKTLGGWFLLTQLLFIFPRFIRDFFYKMIARNRFKWFGKIENCFVLNEEDKNKFL